MNELRPVPLMNTAEAAAYLGVPAKTLAVWRVRKRQHGPVFMRIGRHVRYRQADLDAFIYAHRADYAGGQ